MLQALPAMFSLMVQIPSPLAVVVPSPMGNQMSELVCPVVHLKTRRQSLDASQEVANVERQRSFAVEQGLLCMFCSKVHSLNFIASAEGKSPIFNQRSVGVVIEVSLEVVSVFDSFALFVLVAVGCGVARLSASTVLPAGEMFTPVELAVELVEDCFAGGGSPEDAP
ncbi:MAG: hypothetical protein RIR26_2858 [Pseudomonadota bacterium]